MTRQSRFHADTSPSYREAVQTASALLAGGRDPLSSEYARGQITLIADLFGVPGMDLEARMAEVKADILTAQVAS